MSRAQSILVIFPEDLAVQSMQPLVKRQGLSVLVGDAKVARVTVRHHQGLRISFGEDRAASLVGILIKPVGLIGAAYLAQYDPEQAARLESLFVVRAWRHPPPAHRSLGKFLRARVVPLLEQKADLVDDQAPGIRAVLVEDPCVAEMAVDAGQEVPITWVVWPAWIRGDKQPGEDAPYSPGLLRRAVPGIQFGPAGVR